jgi:hypothetical protein
MAESAKDLGKKGLALLILLGAAYLLFEIVVGVASAIIWTLVVIGALVAAIWALSRLL